MAFTFTINGHTYTSDPSDTTTPAGYRFIGYGYITALANLAVDIVAVAGAAMGYRDSAGSHASDAASSAGVAVAAAESAAASAAVSQSATAFVDTSPIVKGSTDPTKMMRIEVDANVPSGTTVTLAAPSESGTFATQEWVAGSATTLEELHAIALSF